MTKAMMIFLTNNWQRILTATSFAILASSYCFSDTIAQPLSQDENLLIAQTLGGIERKIPLEEVTLPAMASATATAGVKPTTANVEMQPDGSLVYELAGQNQQGFKFIIDVTPNGKIIEVDEQVDPSAVPEAVYKALKKWAPNAQIAETWRSTRLGEFVYEIVIEEFWFEITADGKTITIHQL
ncbi:MAG: hypothetical protein F6K10_09125 [Moorea sp. SIO2B7]|nr:hypothetical protein [Moorena sp. SIO2B7]